jgi:hypothetical protein
MKSRTDEWHGRCHELSQLVNAVLGSCRQLSLLATTVVSVRHPVFLRHLLLMEALGAVERGEYAEPNPSSNGSSIARRWLKAALGRAGLLLGVRLLRAWFHCLHYALRYSIATIRLRSRFGSLLRELQKNPAAVMLRTTCIDLRSLETSDDFFYGKLPTRLLQLGVSCLMLCTDYKETFFRSGTDLGSVVGADHSG